jgi:hypothetical protein
VLAERGTAASAPGDNAQVVAFRGACLPHAVNFDGVVAVKLKASHIVVIVLLALAGFMAFAIWRSQQPPARLSGRGDAAFLEEVRQRQAAVPIDEGAAGSVLPTADNAMHAPHLEVDRREIDLGEVPNTEPSTYSIALRNTGDLPLRIIDVKNSCDCTRGILPSGGIEIPAGGENKLEILVNPFRIPGFDATRTVSILSNDPAQPTLELSITSRVKPEFEVEPHEVDLGVVDKGQPYTTAVIVRQLEDTPLEIFEVNTHGEQEPGPFDGEISYALARRPESEWKSPGKAEYEITATFSPEIPSGTRSAYLFMKTNMPRLPWHFVRVRGVFEAPYTLSPRNPDVLSVPGDGSSAVTVTITGKPGLEVQNVRYDVKKLLATLRPGDTPGVVHLDVLVAPDAAPGQLHDQLLFDVVQDGVTYPERINARAMVVISGSAIPGAGTIPAPGAPDAAGAEASHGEN